MLRIVVTKVSNTHHTLSYTREDGFTETKEFESKSVLEHDFIHFALESTLGLRDGVLDYWNRDILLMT